MGETRVDLYHLLEDLRDAYPGSLEETILTEIISNSLDSGAARVVLTADPGQRVLTVVDNGSEMKRRELSRFHDLAASTKTRGRGIGFAGVGIKLELLISEEVTTETHRGATHVASSWRLASRQRAPWKWVSPPGLLSERGTAVRLTLHNALSPLMDPGFVEAALRRHFQPLLDPAFDQLFARYYPKGVEFQINGQVMARTIPAVASRATIEIRLARKRKPSAAGYVLRSDQALPEEQRGIAISTYGKVIRRGWEWLGLTPAAPEFVSGLIEAPELATCLALNKADFVRVGSRGAMYLGYRKAIQEGVSRQLSEWGDVRDAAEDNRPRTIRPLERDLERVLEDLSGTFPLLASLVEHKAGGQKKLPIGRGEGQGQGQGDDLTAQAPAVLAVAGIHADHTAESPDSQAETPPDERNQQEEGEPSQDTASPEVAEPAARGTMLPERRASKRPGRYGLAIQFETRDDDRELGRLVESTVWVNQAHPAYARALDSRSIGYHIALAVGLALAPLAVDPPREHEFLTAFLAKWGHARHPPKGARSRRR